MIGVIQVPIFWPRIIGIAEAKVICPVEVSAWRIPMDAAELWIIAVTPAPARTPRTGLEKFWNSAINSGTSSSGATASLIWNIPKNRIPNPSKICPRSFWEAFFPAIKRMIPMIETIGAQEVGFKRLMMKLSLWMSIILKMWAVMVVPMLAPMMTPIACLSLMMFALTRPTTMTVVAEELCTAAVTSAPKSTALKMLLLIFSSVRSKRPPEAFSRPVPNRCIP